MKAIKIPSFLHEVFGEQQSIATILVILAFGGCLTLAVSLVFRISCILCLYGEVSLLYCLF